MFGCVDFLGGDVGNFHDFIAALAICVCVCCVWLFSRTLLVADAVRAIPRYTQETAKSPRSHPKAEL